MESVTAYALITAALALGYALGRRTRSEPLAPPVQPDPEALEAVRLILDREGKIAAIKAYRERTGCGLRDAKLAVDTLQ